MNALTLRTSVFIATLASGVFMTAAGCSSSSSSSSSSGLCSDYQSYISKCGITDACSVAIGQNCSTYFSVYSSAYTSAVTPCLNNLQCGDAGNDSASTCIDAATAKLTPSAAQTKFATDFCNACAVAEGQTVAVCTTAFFGADGFGSSIIGYNDATVSSLDSSCLSAADASGACEDGSVFSCLELGIEAASHTPAACEETSLEAGASAGGSSSGTSHPIIPSWHRSR